MARIVPNQVENHEEIRHHKITYTQNTGERLALRSVGRFSSTVTGKETPDSWGLDQICFCCGFFLLFHMGTGAVSCGPPVTLGTQKECSLTHFLCMFFSIIWSNSLPIFLLLSAVQFLIVLFARAIACKMPLVTAILTSDIFQSRVHIHLLLHQG